MSGGQGEFSFPNGWGGRRKGAGRKPVGRQAGVSHRVRTRSKRYEPLFVTMKLRWGLPSLRLSEEATVIQDAIRRGNEREDFRVVHATIQHDHLHLLVEADDFGAQSSGLGGLAIRMARALNRLWDRKGRVFKDRYHARVLRSPNEVRYALLYVFQNATKHRIHRPGHIDRLSSALTFFKQCLGECPDRRLWFDLWTQALRSPLTWLLEIGWKKAGGSITPRTLSKQMAGVALP